MTPYFDGGNLTIYHGDAREIIPGLDKVGLILTDPPYSIGAGRGEWGATAAVAISLHEAAKKLRKDGAMLVFTTTSGRGIEFTQGALSRHLTFNRLLIWQKVGGYSRAISPWRWDTAAILMFGRSPKGSGTFPSVFQSELRYERETDHPAELPDGISDWLYSPFAEQNPRVLDPFMGSGRLLESPLRHGAQVIGIDVEERYCELAAKRLRHCPYCGGDCRGAANHERPSWLYAS